LINYSILYIIILFILNVYEFYFLTHTKYNNNKNILLDIFILPNYILDLPRYLPAYTVIHINKTERNMTFILKYIKNVYLIKHFKFDFIVF